MGVCGRLSSDMIVTAEADMDMPRDGVIRSGPKKSSGNLVVTIYTQLRESPRLVFQGIQEVL